MRKSQPTHPKATIELTTRGVFQITTTRLAARSEGRLVGQSACAPLASGIQMV